MPVSAEKVLLRARNPVRGNGLFAYRRCGELRLEG
jgi:hypothetical protein